MASEPNAPHLGFVPSHPIPLCPHNQTHGKIWTLLYHQQGHFSHCMSKLPFHHTQRNGMRALPSPSPKPHLHRPHRTASGSMTPPRLVLSQKRRQDWERPHLTNTSLTRDSSTLPPLVLPAPQSPLRDRAVVRRPLQLRDIDMGRGSWRPTCRGMPCRRCCGVRVRPRRGADLCCRWRT
jgi:hypothetical protein